MPHSLSSNPLIHCVAGEPLRQYQLWLSDRSSSAILLVDFELEQWWLEGRAAITLTAIYCQFEGQVHCAVTDKALSSNQSLNAGQQFQEWVTALNLYPAVVGQVLPLAPQYIPKPWGQEIWFTGVEERGVCCFGTAAVQTPIPWLQAVYPDELIGRGSAPLVLLKVLDPAPEEVTGDLYFELHQEKREVYVVTHVDSGAWPDGVGYIRYGFDPELVASADSEEAFRQAYLAAVKAYEVVRREIDECTGHCSEGLLKREVTLRREMERFTHKQPLSVGDVVVVPLLMPHSLQHGVRTIEFQTPVYERKILSFAQQVLTQNHWDTEAAVEQMRLLPPPIEPFERMELASGVSAERIIDFPDFEVRRVRFEPGSEHTLLEQASYALVMLVAGQLNNSGLKLSPEQAALIPKNTPLSVSVPEGSDALILLLATPRI